MDFLKNDFFSGNLDELLGVLFIELEMPERPKESFFAGLFGVGVRNVDREELCKAYWTWLVLV